MQVGELNIRTNELQQKLTESERNLHDVIRSYDAERDRLKDQLSNQGVELNKKHEEISVLLKQHNDLVHKNREYEQTIALLMKDRKHCNCKCILKFTLYVHLPHMHTKS